MMRKFSEIDGRLYAIMNWDSRKGREDVAIIKYLTEEEAETYREHKREGLSDTSIFKVMFPPAERPADRPPPGSRQFSALGGALYAVMNWSARRSDDDVAVIKYLTPGEATEYRRLRREGLGDTQIFERLFPARPLPPHGEMRLIQIDLSSLNKRQLVRLIEAELDAEMPSLTRSSRDDLEKLLLKLHRRD